MNPFSTGMVLWTIFSWVGLIVLLAVAMHVAAAIGSRDDGPPPDDMDEKPSPPP